MKNSKGDDGTSTLKVVPQPSGFTAGELKELGCIGDSDRKALFGFRAVSKLRFVDGIRAPYCVYLDESVVKVNSNH
jgi:hypothetical protein